MGAIYLIPAVVLWILTLALWALGAAGWAVWISGVAAGGATGIGGVLAALMGSGPRF